MSAVSAGAIALGPTETRASVPTEIPLAAFVGQLKTISVTIEGRAARLLFDTGASLTSITPAFADRIGRTPWGHVTGFRMNGERVSFQRCSEVRIAAGDFVSTRELSVFDLSTVLPPQLPPIDGIAGLDLFDGFAVTLSELSSLRVETQTSLRRITRGLQAAPIRTAREAAGAGVAVFVPVTSAAGTLWFLLDSGNLAGIRMHPAAYFALGGSDSSAVALPVVGAGLQETTPDIVEALIYDGALDAGFLSARTVTIDIARHRIWWRESRGV